jgi:topoisomerase-4 subunit A
MVETVVDEPVTILVSRNGFLRSRAGHGIDRAALSWKEGDAPLAIVETRTTWPIVAMGANGRAYNLQASDLPGGKGDGVPVSSLADTRAAPSWACSPAPETPVLFGPAPETPAREDRAPGHTRSAGKQFVTVGEGDALVTAIASIPRPGGRGALGRGPPAGVPGRGGERAPNGGRGVMAIRLHEKEAMLGIRPADAGIRIAAIGRSDKRISIEVKPGDLEHLPGARARTGRVLQPYFKRIEGFE